jgi:glycosyltransferase involved in cell wall biosynthesis
MFDLSIVIPTCNRGELLRRNLSSLRQSIRCSFEVIVVDGASEDDTANALADAAKDFGDRLKVIREERREGFVRAANKGFVARNFGRSGAADRSGSAGSGVSGDVSPLRLGAKFSGGNCA